MNAGAADPRYWKKLYALISWLGIALNAGIALAFMFIPERVVALLGVGSDPITWVQLCGELLTLITIFYVFPARDVDHYRPHAWIAAVGSRGLAALLLFVVVFCFGAPRAFLIGAAMDLVIGGIQVFLLLGLQRVEIGRGSATHPHPPLRDYQRAEGIAPQPVGGESAEVAHWKRVYRWVATIGIAANMLFVLPFVFLPRQTLALLGVGSRPLAWTQLDGLLLGIISLFYVPAIMNVDRYRLFAWLAIFPSRAFGFLFGLIAGVFLGANDAFLLAIVLDLPFAVAQVFILAKLERAERRQRGGVQPARHAWTGWWREALAILTVLFIVGTVAGHKLLREYPQQLADRTIEEFFKHGSIGAEDAQGMPYWIWITLPTVFPEYLPKPGGYASLGLVWERGSELPNGFSRKKIGFDRVAINCALCHSGSVQVPGEARPRPVLGAPATTVSILDYQHFLFRSVRDPRFTADTLLAVIGRHTQLSWIDSLLYRFILIPQTRSALRKQATIWEWTEEKDRPPWGAGRIEPFNPVKLSILNSVDSDVKVGSTLGTSDMQPLWNLGAHPGRRFHWDGLNDNLTEVFDSSALGDGSTKKSTPRERLRELQDWLSKDNAPPRFEALFKDAVKPELVKRGEAVYSAECARCHAPGGEKVGKVIPVLAAAAGTDAVGTDGNRARMWTPEAAKAYNRYLGKLPWAFHGFRSSLEDFPGSGGYVSVPLDGLWLRAPYLHNGSVPTLTDLLKPPGERPTAFLRGLNEYDTKNVGFVAHAEYPQSASADGEPAAGSERAPKDAADPAKYGGFRYETSGRGNSNEGHTYGTALPAPDKEALVEYLKTL